ncbi:hypothetical protein NMY22_g7769 [Coprinellus aureogranulatus]|nr:hypothetical protein NMY22_g7769 [Coprinellus aureogranulatus]
MHSKLVGLAERWCRDASKQKVGFHCGGGTEGKMRRSSVRRFTGDCGDCPKADTAINMRQHHLALFFIRYHILQPALSLSQRHKLDASLVDASEPRLSPIFSVIVPGRREIPDIGNPKTNLDCREEGRLDQYPIDHATWLRSLGLPLNRMCAVGECMGAERMLQCSDPTTNIVSPFLRILSSITTNRWPTPRSAPFQLLAVLLRTVWVPPGSACEGARVRLPYRFEGVNIRAPRYEDLRQPEPLDARIRAIFHAENTSVATNVKSVSSIEGGACVCDQKVRRDRIFSADIFRPPALEVVIASPVNLSITFYWFKATDSGLRLSFIFSLIFVLQSAVNELYELMQSTHLAMQELRMSAHFIEGAFMRLRADWRRYQAKMATLLMLSEQDTVLADSLAPQPPQSRG